MFVLDISFCALAAFVVFFNVVQIDSGDVECFKKSGNDLVVELNEACKSAKATIEVPKRQLKIRGDSSSDNAKEIKTTLVMIAGGCSVGKNINIFAGGATIWFWGDTSSKALPVEIDVTENLSIVQINTNNTAKSNCKPTFKATGEKFKIEIGFNAGEALPGIKFTMFGANVAADQVDGLDWYIWLGIGLAVLVVIAGSFGGICAIRKCNRRRKRAKELEDLTFKTARALTPQPPPPVPPGSSAAAAAGKKRKPKRKKTKEKSERQETTEEESYQSEKQSMSEKDPSSAQIKSLQPAADPLSRRALQRIAWQRNFRKTPHSERIYPGLDRKWREYSSEEIETYFRTLQREERRVRDPIDHIETEAELKQIQVERETDKAAYEEAQRRIEQLKKDAPIADPIYDGPKDKQNEYRDDPRIDELIRPNVLCQLSLKQQKLAEELIGERQLTQQVLEMRRLKNVMDQVKIERTALSGAFVR